MAGGSFPLFLRRNRYIKFLAILWPKSQEKLNAALNHQPTTSKWTPPRAKGSEA